MERFARQNFKDQLIKANFTEGAIVNDSRVLWY